LSLLVDSSVWIDYFSGNTTPETDYLNAILGESVVFVGDLILAEVLQGFRQESDFKLARDALLKFPIVEVLGRKIAIQSASNYRLLRSKGITVRKTIDSLIATYCIENDLELLHSDRDFEPFEEYLGLRVVHPS